MRDAPFCGASSVIAGLREARDNDSADLIALMTVIYDSYPGCKLLVEEEEPDLLEPATAFDDGGGWWVVEREGLLIASVALSPSHERDGWGKLRKLYVDARARGEGLGSAMVHLVEAAAAERGFQHLHLWSDSRFDAAHRLYERLGWRRSPLTRTLPDFSRTTELEFLKQI